MSERSIYRVEFAEDYHGPASVRVHLPNGGVKAFNRLQKDRAAKDFPRIDVPMTEADARELRKHGFSVRPVPGLEQMLVKQLRKLAADEGVDLEGAKTKTEIVEVIRLHRSPLSKIQTS